MFLSQPGNRPERIGSGGSFSRAAATAVGEMGGNRLERNEQVVPVDPIGVLEAISFSVAL